MTVKRTSYPRRRVGRPRRAPVRRVNPYVNKQTGDGFGSLIGPILKVVAPLVAGEILKFGVQTGLKRMTGKGMAGNGLKLAGRGHGIKPAYRPARRANGKYKKRGSRKMRIQPFPYPMKPNVYH